MNLSVELAPKNPKGLKLANPLMLASGTCGYGMEVLDMVVHDMPGGLVCKGTTLEPRQGNAQPRISEAETGMLNAIGLENIGVKALISQKAPLWKKAGLTVIVNISGSRPQEYAELAGRLDGVEGISGIEANISCPNVQAGGIEFGMDAGQAAEVTRLVRGATSLPLLVKLSPGACAPDEVAQAVEEAGADALTVANTFKGMAIDIHSCKPSLANTTGGLSGPVLKPVTLAMVYQLASRVSIPLIACGGITSSEDAIEYIMAGARAFQIGTAFLVNPALPGQILEGIRGFLENRGAFDIAEITGAAVVGSKEMA